MTTMDATPSLRDYLVMRLASKVASKRNKATPVRLTWLQAIVRQVLHIAGFALLTWAGFQWNSIAGLVIAGLSCFVLSTLLTSRTATDDTPPHLRR